MSGTLRVAVRIRPPDSAASASPTVQAAESQIVLAPRQKRSERDAVDREPKTYAFDHAYGTEATQEQIFDDIGVSVLDHAFAGYNTCIFAYGQTGSGKSHTMMGQVEDEGLIPRIATALYDKIAGETDHDVQCHVQVSYMEIYNEKIRDLLSPACGHALRVREHPSTGPYVEDLSSLPATSYDDVKRLIDDGTKSRSVAATAMNEVSSRSHAVFTIVLKQTRIEAGLSTELVSKLSLVDLAGSERVSKTKATGARLKEGAEINKSLTTLGRVISALSSERKPVVPYRDSTLTWLLKDSIGGNSMTTMIATVSSLERHYDETLSTLRYADSAKRIQNHAIVNEDPNARIIRELKKELDELRLQRGEQGPTLEGSVTIHDSAGNEISLSKAEIAERIEQSTKLVAELNLSWEQKLAQRDAAERERENLLAELGVQVDARGVSISTPRKTPYLVNLSEDPQLSECLIYNLRDGLTRCGTTGDAECEIKLGITPDVACTFTNNAQAVFVEPAAGASIMVNGHLISSATPLYNGFRIVIGSDVRHVFRFNDPRPSRLRPPEPLARSPTPDGLFEDRSSPRTSIRTPRPDNEQPLSEELASLPRDGLRDVLARVVPDETKLDSLIDSIQRLRSLSAGLVVGSPLEGKAHQASEPEVLDERAIQELNAQRLQAEARGQVKSMSVLDRLREAQEEASLRRRSTPMRSSPIDIDTVVRRAARRWRQRYSIALLEQLLQSGRLLKAAQIAALTAFGGPMLQFAVIHRDAMDYVSPLESDEVFYDMQDCWQDDRRRHPRLVCRIIDVEAEIVFFTTLKDVGRSLARVQDLGNSRRRNPFCRRPTPSYTHFGSAALPVPSRCSHSGAYDLDIVSAYTFLPIGILRCELECAITEDGTTINLVIDSISGIADRDGTDVHVHAWLDSDREARLTTRPTRASAGGAIEFGARFSIGLAKGAPSGDLHLQVFAAASSAFCEGLLAWDRLQSQPPIEARLGDVPQTLLKVAMLEPGDEGDFVATNIVRQGLKSVSLLRQGLTRHLSVSIEHGNVDSVVLRSAELVHDQDHSVVAIKPPELVDAELRRRDTQTWALEVNSKLLNAITPSDKSVKLELLVRVAEDTRHYVLRQAIYVKIVRRDHGPGFMSRMLGGSKDSKAIESSFALQVSSSSIGRLAAFDSAHDRLRGEEVLSASDAEHAWQPRDATLVTEFTKMQRQRAKTLEVLRHGIVSSAISTAAVDPTTNSTKARLGEIVHYWRHIARHHTNEAHDVERLLRAYERKAGGAIIDADPSRGLA